MSEERVAQAHARILLARSDNNRDPRLQAAIHHADGVAEPGGDVHVGQWCAACRLCIKAGTAYGNAFVEGHNVFYIGVLKQTFQQWVFCGAGISEYSVATMESEALHKHLSSSHGLPS